MTTPAEEAKKKEDREEAAQGRLKSADRIKNNGAKMMIAGGVLFAVAITAFILAREPEIPSWVRQTALTLIGMLWIGGLGLCITGHSLRQVLAQQADDRAERTAQHEELLTEIREIKRRQAFIRAHLSDEGTSPPRPAARKVPLPSAETLDLVRRQRDRETQASADAANDPKPKGEGERDLAKLADMAEWWNLATEVERRRHDPPPTDETPKTDN